MKYNNNKERWELTDTEMLKRLRKEWERKRDALPLNDTDSFHYFNGGVNALSDLLMDIIHGDRNARK